MTTAYYQDDKVTLYLGDCRDVTDWLAADVLVTDPPYGIHHSAHGQNTPAVTGEKRTGRASDRTLGPEHIQERDDALRLWQSKPAMVFGSWRAPRPARTQMRLVWDKQMIGMGGVGAWRPSDEEVYLLNWPNPKHQGGNKGSVIRGFALRGEHRPDHPTPKPVALMELLIGDCPPGIIADPFAGSGSTLVAARNLGRQAIGLEIEERYCELIARRLSQDCLDLGGVA